jgi:hypothetical protein
VKSIFPIYYFGNISYYKDICAKKELVFEINDFYLKQTNRNRLVILSANGKQELTIPVVKINGSKTISKDIKIVPSTDWKKDHWRAILSSYKHAPYFEHYESEIYHLIHDKHIFLIDLTLQSHQLIRKWLNLPIEDTLTTEFTPYKLVDFRVGHTDHPYTSEYSYIQVFNDKIPFQENLSTLDAILNLGPMARKLFL